MKLYSKIIAAVRISMPLETVKHLVIGITV